MAPAIADAGLDMYILLKLMFTKLCKCEYQHSHFTHEADKAQRYYAIVISLDNVAVKLGSFINLGERL